MRELAAYVPVAVIEGDQETPMDAIRLLPVSAVSGAGLDEWHDWLRAAVPAPA